MRVAMRDRQNGSFQFIVSKGFDTEGKRLRDYVEFRGNRTEAKKALTKLQSECDRGEYVTPTQFTLAEYLDEWLRLRCRTNVSGTTYERYEGVVKNHLKPALGSTKLQSLAPLQIETLYSALLERKLAPQTVLYVHRVLHSALQWAKRKNIVARNVADNVDIPRAKRTQMNALDEDQTAAVLEILESTDSDLYLPALVAVGTGIRRGELIALRWVDLDLDGLTLTVSRSLQETREGLSFKMPKNGTSRTVGIPQELSRELLAHRKRQAEHRLALGHAYKDEGLVFPGLDGGPLNPHAFSRKFDRFKVRQVEAARKIAEELEEQGHKGSPEHARAVAVEGLLAFRWHDWRHSYASQQLRAGEQVLVVSRALGHATTAFTMDVYGHVLPGEQKAAADRHGERIAAARERRQAAAIVG